MPRPKNVTKARDLHVCIPPEEANWLEISLYSEAEQRVPVGAKARFISECIRERMAGRVLDMAPYLVGFPSGSFIRGPNYIIEALETELKKG